MEPTAMQETAALARLCLSEQDTQALFPAFEQMLTLFDTMQECDSDTSMPAIASQADFVTTAQPVSSSHFRQDTEQQELGKDTIEFMLSQAPERDGNFIVIPNVL